MAIITNAATTFGACVIKAAAYPEGSGNHACRDIHVGKGFQKKTASNVSSAVRRHRSAAAAPPSRETESAPHKARRRTAPTGAGKALASQSPPGRPPVPE